MHTPHRHPWARPAVLLAKALCVLTALAALGEGSLAVPAPPSAPPAPPARLSETGLFLADGSLDPRNRPFTPQYPLWTDGASKSRWIRLPAGARIDARDPDAWRFPAGPTVWKQFAWNGRKVETRMIRIERDGRWTFATYLWNDEQTDAVLAPEGGVARAFEIAPARWHAVPGRADCTACHGSAPSRLLGFSALQLSDDRDPLAPHAEPLAPGMITLRTLVAERLLSPARPEFARRPPRIPAADPVERAARGYLSANCGHCHDARGPLARLGFSLQAGATASAIGAHTRFDIPDAVPGTTVAIAPGEPERSAIAYRMSSRRPSSQMPPLGTALADSEGVALVRRWIVGLPRTAAAAPHSTTANLRTSVPAGVASRAR